VPTPNISAAFNCSFNVLGQVATYNIPFLGSSAPIINQTLAAGAAGTLTTRTDGFTGTLTMSPGHGITTGQRLDIYWTVTSSNFSPTGQPQTVSRVLRNCLVGTVSGNSVPFTNVNNLGTSLPIATTPVIASVPIVTPLEVLASPILMAIFCQAQGPCMLDFSSSATATINDGTAELFPLPLAGAPYIYSWLLSSIDYPGYPTSSDDDTGIVVGGTQAVNISNGTLLPNNVKILAITQ
jgi:hypothetical protein